MNLQRTIAQAALAQATALLLVGWWFRHALNTDAIAYLRVAEYYTEGKLGLAISGYWGPLLSWLMAPLLEAGLSPLTAARLIMAASAVLFFWSCVALLHAAELPPRWRKTGLCAAAACSIPWSVANITPDLLLAALVVLAMAFLFAARHLRPALFTVTAGMLFGLAFLAKAVALPLAALIGLVWHGWRWRNDALPGPRAWFFGAVFAMGVALPTLPWVGILTHHYGQLTLSTSARIAHTIAGPNDQDRYHPFARQFHRPEPGRITSWEDPSRMAYRDWSPWENADYAKHQAKLVLSNSGLSQLMLTTIFLDWPCVLVLALLCALRPVWRMNSAPMPIVPASIFILSLVLAYLPGYLRLAEQRFFYAALPFLFITGAWLVETVERKWKIPVQGAPETSESGQVWPELAPLAPAWRKWSGLALFGSFAIPSLILLVAILPRKQIAGELALELATRMKRTGLSGPIAGSALQPGGRTGLYLAYRMNQPWHGDELSPTPTACRQSGAKFYAVNRSNPLAAELSKAGGFRDLTPALFASPEEAADFPVLLFEIRDVTE